MPRLILGVVLAKCHTNCGGHTCAIMSWAMAFREMGWEVWITEHLDEKQLDAHPTIPETTLQENFWRQCVAEFGFEGRECLIIKGESPELAAMLEFAEGADLFLNYSGQFPLVDLLKGVKKRAYLDVDPAFTQLWVETCDVDMNFAGHDVFFSVGLNINGTTADMPMAGINWIPVPPPMPAEYWRQRLAKCQSDINAGDAWTTVGHWYGYSDLVWKERIYGGKRDSFLALTKLPLQVPVGCAVATDLQPDWGGDDYTDFVAAKWGFFSAKDVCRDIASYLNFINSSRGEIGIAKGGYLLSHCGWISDRSLVYLAFGRPVLLQDTGWPEVLPSAEGMLPFHDLESCAAGIRKIESDYERHSLAARSFVEKWMSPQVVVDTIVKGAGL